MSPGFFAGTSAWALYHSPEDSGLPLVCDNDRMPAASDKLCVEVRRIQVITLMWMAVEAAVSLVAAWRAHSLALLGFGGDSGVELLSAAIVWWRFSPNVADEDRERIAAKLAGVLLFALAAIVVLGALMAFAGRIAPGTSPIGIVLLILAAAIMPWLAREKRRLAEAAGSAALKADAAESAVCGYLAIIALAGLVLNAVWNARWADPLAAVALLPLILHEGWEAVHHQSCNCTQ